jgi:hypothetical protein
MALCPSSRSPSRLVLLLDPTRDRNELCTLLRTDRSVYR